MDSDVMALIPERDRPAAVALLLRGCELQRGAAKITAKDVNVFYNGSLLGYYRQRHVGGPAVFAQNHRWIDLGVQLDDAHDTLAELIATWVEQGVL